jgi:hypothetical protein
MKYFIIFVMLASLTSSLNAQDTIRFIGFEGDSTQWKGKGIGSAGHISDPFSLLKGDTLVGTFDFPDSNRILSGKRSWQIVNDQDTLILDSVSVAFYDSVRLVVRFTGTSTNNGQGLDNDDSVKIFVATNGAAFKQIPQISITGGQGPGQSNSTWGFSADSIIKTSYDTSKAYVVPNAGNDTLTASSTAIINFFKPGITSIRVMILASNNKNSEVWNFDNILLSGKKSRGLAIKGISFEASAMNSGVMLHWKNANEAHCYQYEVQRSQDITSFASIKSMACNGNENVAAIHSFFDPNPRSGWNYYRIKLTQDDGIAQYTEIKSVYRNLSNAFKVFPTLAHNHLEISAPLLTDYQYTITDMNGRVLEHRQVHASGQQSIAVEHLTTGLYILAVNTGSESTSFKFVKM